MFNIQVTPLFSDAAALEAVFDLRDETSQR